MYVCVCMCMYMCLYGSIYVGMCACVCMCMYVYACVCAYVGGCITDQRKFITSGMVWIPFDWLNKFYSYHLPPPIISIVNRYGLKMKCIVETNLIRQNTLVRMVSVVHMGVHILRSVKKS